MTTPTTSAEISRDDCIEWPYTRTRYGYGKVPDGKRGRYQLAHRLTWEEANGPIPPGMIVMHACDNPPCIFLDHLRLGTKRDNSLDMMRKGRGRYVPHPGERNGRSKLTEQIVREIRASTETPSEIAFIYGIHPSSVWLIRRRKTWRHVQDQPTTENQQ